MLTTRKRQRTQRTLWLLGFLLLLIYLFAYRPLSQRAQELDAPLEEVWKALAEATGQTNSYGREYLMSIDSLLEQTEESAALLARVRSNALSRIEPDAATRARMERSFQLFEFLSERQVLLEQIAQLAAQKKVGLGPEVSAGFPEYTADRRNAGLLWPQLESAYHLVSAAILSQVSTVSVLRLPPFELMPQRTNVAWRLAELPISVQLAGSAQAIARFLEMLPLKTPEIAERQLGEVPDNKPVFFVRRILARKESRSQLAMVNLHLTVSTLVTVPVGNVGSRDESSVTRP